jgi:hypothetical protein
MTTCIERALVDSHFRGEISAKDERRMRSHLTDCGTCQSHYRRRQILAQLDPEAPTPEERLAKGLGLGAERSKLLWPMLVSALACAAALVFVLRAPSDDGFRARGSLNSSASTESTISVYRVSDRTVLSTSGSFHRDDELAFTYDNTSHEPYVMIFGVDEHDRVYWFYPAWTDESENPMAVKTDPGRVTVALPEAIKHPFEGSKLTVHGLFLDTPRTVRDVEAALRDHQLGGMPGAIDRTTTFEVLK